MIGWMRGRELVGDYDMLHLWPKSTDALAHSLAWNACQVLSLASAFRVRKERSRNSKEMLRDKVAMLKEEHRRSGDDKEKARDECSRLLKEFKGKLRECEKLRNELGKLKEEHSLELETGAQFLNSSVGKALLASTCEKAIEAYRAYSAFKEDVFEWAMTLHDEVVVDYHRQLRETRLVTEEIIMMIEPSVLEAVEGILGYLLHGPVTF